MKKLIAALTIMIVVLGLNNTSVRSESKENKEKFYITNTYVNDSNSTIVEFNDGSITVCNYENKLYEFYHVDLGDWGLKVNNKQQLINVIKTYMENKYKMNEKEINNSTIFKDKNLVNEVEIKENNKQEKLNVVEKEIKNSNNVIENTEVKNEKQKTNNKVKNNDQLVEQTKENKEMQVNEEPEVNEPKLNHQVNSLNDFNDKFKDYNITNSYEVNGFYSLNNDKNETLMYDSNIDMFYHVDSNHNTVDYESIEDFKNYLDDNKVENNDPDVENENNVNIEQNNI